MILMARSQRGGMGREVHMCLSVKLAVRLSRIMDKLEGSMPSKSCKLKVKELEIFSRRITKRWMPKETHFQLMISTGVSKEINTVPKWMLMKKCRIKWPEDKFLDKINLEALMIITFPIHLRKTVHRFFLMWTTILKKCTLATKRRTCPMFK